MDTELVRGSGGVFNVSVDNRRIFSKHDEGRFPSESEILDALRTALQSSPRAS